METATQPILKPRPKRPLNPEHGKRMRALALKSPKIGKRGKDKVTLTKEQAYLNMQEKIIARSMKLTNAQTMLGLGTIKVFRIDAHYEMFGRVKKLVKEKPVIVKDDEEIIKVLDYEYNDGENPSTHGDDATEYPQFYFVEVKDANNQAIESQLNRTFGKALEKVDVTSGGNKIAPVIVGMRIIDNSQQSLPIKVDSTIVENGQNILEGSLEEGKT